MKNYLITTLSILSLLMACDTGENVKKTDVAVSVNGKDCTKVSVQNNGPVTEIQTTDGNDPALDKARFVIVKLPGDNPQSEIHVKYGNTKIQVDKIAGEASVVAKPEWARMQIPPNALEACGAWWAGAGNYFYMIVEGTNLNIYKGWQQEEQNDNNFHWELKKTITN